MYFSLHLISEASLENSFMILTSSMMHIAVFVTLVQSWLASIWSSQRGKSKTTITSTQARLSEDAGHIDTTCRPTWGHRAPLKARPFWPGRSDAATSNPRSTSPRHQSPPASPVSSPCHRCGRFASAATAAHRSVSPCVGLCRAPPKLIVYPTITAPASGRVHNAMSHRSRVPCARVVAASSLHSRVGRHHHRFGLPQGSPVHSSTSTPSAPPLSRRHRWGPSPCTTSSPCRPRARVAPPCQRPPSTMVQRRRHTRRHRVRANAAREHA
jgi:hypothetical protein